VFLQTEILLALMLTQRLHAGASGRCCSISAGAWRRNDHTMRAATGEHVGHTEGPEVLDMARLNSHQTCQQLFDLVLRYAMLLLRNRGVATRHEVAASPIPKESRAWHLSAQQRHGGPLASLLPLQRQLLPFATQKLMWPSFVLAIHDEVIPNSSRNQRNSFRQILHQCHNSSGPGS